MSKKQIWNAKNRPRVSHDKDDFSLQSGLIIRFFDDISTLRVGGAFTSKDELFLRVGDLVQPYFIEMDLKEPASGLLLAFLEYHLI